VTGPARQRRRDVVAGVLLSYRESDAALRARNGTTATLVANGLLRAVPWSGRMRVPRPELERYSLALLTAEPQRPKRRRDSGTCDPDALRSLDLRTL
jgi:hypothetical protein